MSLQQQTLTQSAEAQIDELIKRMTLPEKIGQMTQVEKNSLQPQDVTTYFIGSVLSGGGGNPIPNNPQNWARMVREYQEAALKTRLKIPLLYGVDAVHGHNNVKGAVIFPHNIAMGAAADEDLVARIARITAAELLATGVHWNFAPAVSVPQDVRWGRTYEGYSENTDLVTRLGTSYIRALQSEDQRVLASAKHFVADGGAKWGTTAKPADHADNWQRVTDTYSIDQGDVQVDEATLRTQHLAPYLAAIAEGTLTIMVSHSSWLGLKASAHYYLLTEVLKEECGFQGFLVSDWKSIDQLDPDYYTCIVRSINAGLDMIMVPFAYKQFIESLTLAIERGDITLQRVDNAVRRILRAKFGAGLFDNPFGREELLAAVGSSAHRAVAREAVRKSLVLLKNEDNVLPLPKESSHIFVAGRGADDIGMMCGGWTIEWQGGLGATTQGTTILEGIQKCVSEGTNVSYIPDGIFSNETQAPLGIVVVGETPYAEGVGDRAEPTLSAQEIAIIERMRQHCKKLVIVLLSGRPLIITDQLAYSDAWVAAWLPGTEGNGVADVLFGDYPFVGRLPYTWARTLEHISQESLQQHPEAVLFPFGYGGSFG